MKFKYCPDCGELLGERTMGDEGEVPYCEKCQKPWFDMFSTCVITLVINEFDEAALLRQNYISEKYYNLISGYMKPGEDARTSAIREVEEETGLSVDKIDLTETYWFEKGGVLMIGFIAKAKKKDFVLSKEVDGAKWVDVNEAINLVHPKGSVSHSLIEKYLNE